MIVAICIMISCSKSKEEVVMKTDATITDEIMNQILNEETIVQYSGSDFTYQFLKAVKVSSIYCRAEGCYNVSLLHGESYDVTIDNLRKTISIISNGNEYRIVFQEDHIAVEEVNSNRIRVYSIIEGIGSELDPVITIAIAVKAYQQEVGNIPYQINHENLLFQTESYLCMHPRRSWCSAERMANTIEEYCGGPPTIVGGTDCGCLWGDFFCICITDFEC